MKANNLNWAFDPKIKARQLAIDVVETSFPKEHYQEIMIYEAWKMRTIMENLIEIALSEQDCQIKKFTKAARDILKNFTAEHLDYISMTKCGTNLQKVLESKNETK